MEQITTIDSRHLLTALFLFLGVCLSSHAHATDSNACGAEARSTLTHKLIDYLKKPTSWETRKLTIKLCEISPNGPHPCPISLPEERVADFERAAENNPGIIPVLACAQAVAEGAEAEDLNELQLKLLDRLGGKFFDAWATIPPSVKPLAQKFSDFALLPLSDELSMENKIKILEKRVNTLENAPRGFSKEVASVLDDLKLELHHAKGEAELNRNSDVVFKTSDFISTMKDKLTRMTTKDDARTKVFANETLKDTGLNYKVYLKNENHNWNICSTASDEAAACKVTNVGFSAGKDSCGNYGILGVMLLSGPTWIVPSDTSSFRINAPEYLNPVAVLLLRSEAVKRFWVLPQGFVPKYLSSELRTLTATMPIKSESGEILAELFLNIQDNGRLAFIEPPKDTQDLIVIGRQGSQKIKDLDGASLVIELPKACH